jgi:hypothetical protein
MLFQLINQTNKFFSFVINQLFNRINNGNVNKTLGFNHLNIPWSLDSKEYVILQRI